MAKCNKAEAPEPTLGIKEGKATIVLNATDTLFFRESRPMESMGELQSIFPPTVQTLAGAVRTFIGEQQGINWNEFNADHPLAKIIGYGDNLGALTFNGAWLSYNGKRLYPAPQLLMQKEETISRLAISKKPLWCDLGRKVLLPELSKDAQGSKPLENTWLDQQGLNAVLQGTTPQQESLFKADKLFTTESRVGIGRDNATRAVVKSLLYQTEHIRPKEGLSIELDVAGLPNDMATSAIVRLGGEGRSASLSLQQKAHKVPKAPTANGNTQGIILYLLTPLKFKQVAGKEWQPLPEFEKQETAEQTLWTGTINGIELELHSAITGKTTRDGGWDLAKHAPRTANPLIPAGSAFFCKLKEGDDINSALQTLHNSQIGEQTEYGLGHLIAGLWQK